MEETYQIKLRVVAIVGAKGSGKDELADYLVREHGAEAIEVGAFARKLAEEADKKDETRLHYDVSAKNLAQYGAEHIMQQLVMEILQSDQHAPKALVITGVRTPAEAAVLKENFGSDLLLAFVKVGNQATRFDRLQKRDFTTDPDEFQEFAQQDEEMKEEYGLAETADHADIILWNQASLPVYYRQIETYIVPHLFPTKKKQNS